MYEKEIIQPFISIVIPVYNSEKYISKCIESVLSQSYSKWELILVNDGSTDNSGTICNHYAEKDTRIKVIHKSNEGVGSARNSGIKQASGDFITFIDSDDYISSQYIADFVRCNPLEKSIVISGLITQTPSQKYISFQYADESTLNGTTAYRLIIKYDLLRDGGPVNKLFDLQLIKHHNLQFLTNLSYHEDHIFVYSYYLFIENIILSKFCGYYYMYYGEDSKNSLSRIGKLKVQPLFDASDLFLLITPKIFVKFNISDKKYKAKAITRTGYSQRVLALYNLYFHSYNSINECKQILKNERTKICQIRKEYYPLSIKRKIILNILSLPVSVSHPILLLMRFLDKILKFSNK